MRSRGQQRRRFWQAVIGVIAAVGVVAAMGGTAFADNVVNDVTAGGTDTFVAGGSTTFGYKIVATTGDGQTGCNAADSSPATVNINVPSGITATPSSLTFTACNAFQNVTFSSSIAGDYTVPVSVSDGGAGTYNTTPGTATLHVTSPPPPSNTAPTVSVTGVSGGASYEIGSVPTAGCSVSDTEDGLTNSSTAATPQTTGTLSHGLGTLTTTCSYTDGGGLTDSASATYSIVDTGNPTISGAISPSSPDGTNGWYKSPPTVSFTCADTGGSGIQSCTDPQTLGDGANQSVTGTATDWAGNTAQATVSGINVDTTPPTDVTFVGGPADGGSYPWGYVPAAPTCTANDATSGVASCVVTGYSGDIGAHTLTATATDNAGNQSTATRNFTVVAWTLNGFFQPVDMGGVFNTVKAGSTVPFKFRIFAGSLELTDTSKVKSLTYKAVSCSSLPTDDVEQTATGGTSLRYDTTAQQFVYNWQTPKTPGACLQATMTTLDGSALSALFKLK